LTHQSHQTLLSLNQDCIQLAENLIRILEQERDALVSFEMEKIMKSTLEKSAAARQLSEKRNALRKYAQVRFGKKLSEIQTALPEEELPAWNESQKQWMRVWDDLNRKCQGNQGFLKHSLKNVDLLLSNLKHLFGDPGIYNNAGKRQDLMSSGKVLEGRF